MDDLLGDGIFTSDGLQWQTQRKIASHIFTGRNLHTYMNDIFVNNWNTFKHRLDEYVENSTQLDIQDLYFRYVGILMYNSLYSVSNT